MSSNLELDFLGHLFLISWVSATRFRPLSPASPEEHQLVARQRSSLTELDRNRSETCRLQDPTHD